MVESITKIKKKMETLDTKLKRKQEEFDKIKQELDKLKDEKKRFDRLKPQYRLADHIHSKMCRHNHTDGCGWFYESWDNIGSSRMSYLRRANKILEHVDMENAMKVITNL